jgi:hypothetical protein
LILQLDVSDLGVESGMADDGDGGGSNVCENVRGFHSPAGGFNGHNGEEKVGGIDPLLFDSTKKNVGTPDNG